MILIFSAFAMFHIQNGIYLSMELPPLALFGAMHGRAQNMLEHYFQRIRPEHALLFPGSGGKCFLRHTKAA